ncbi:transglycosylase SLT domain-containing protein [Muricoccus radiodurans]|uniref:transglycosylase SLT domain-containing protein n=1 Tax=Muricoccus radiodurans TaxID=2231721 RepID=UPI003CEB5AFB
MGLAVALLLFGSLPAWAQSCEEAIAAAEPASGLPSGLLGAIARTESGRYDAAARRVIPWAWTINAAGSGAHFPTREEAIVRTRGVIARGTSSVDVGCMQVNLRHHPDAFASLEEAFDPHANVAYAVRFLTALRQRYGDWPGAVAGYHSADPARGSSYLRRVNLAWAGAAPGPEFSSASTAAAPAPDRIVPRVAPAASRVQVFTPTALTPTARPMSVVILMPRRG